MSSNVESFTNAPTIIEWITPYDKRLVCLSGKKPPVDAAGIREEWDVEPSAIPSLLQAVKKLLVPRSLTAGVGVRFDRSDATKGTVALDFATLNTAHQCLPVNDETMVFDRSGVRAYAAIARCTEVAALGVICMEFYDEGGLDFAVQPIRQEVVVSLNRRN